MLHTDLDVYKTAIAFVTDIYKLTTSFPEEERFSLTAQLRRSATSIPSNIAEGAGRSHKKEYIQFLYVALGSLAETETHLIIASKIGYMSEDSEMFLNLAKIKKMILGLIKYLKGTQK
jgi:four helix bundle protein